MTNNTNYDVIIVGAGIGGLTAGNILAKNGKKVLILEKNYAPGGAATIYYKKNYPIDIAHSICGLSEKSFMRTMFEYLGIYDQLELMELEKTFINITDKRIVYNYSDVNRFTDELTNYFPEERNNLNKFFKEVSEIWHNEVLNSYYNPSFPMLLMYPFLFPRLFKYRNYTFGHLLDNFFQSTEIKDFISIGWPYLGLEMNYVSALYMICMLGAYHNDKSYFVKGGIGKIPKVLASTFEKQGGEIIYRTEVNKVILNKNRVSGVQTESGHIFNANIVFSNIDTKQTFTKLVGENDLPKEFFKKINCAKMSSTILQVHVSAIADIDKRFLSSGSIILPSNVDLEENLRKKMGFQENNTTKKVLILSINKLEDFLPTEEKNNYIFNVGWIPANFSLWKKFISNTTKEEYEQIKNDIATVTIKELKKIWDIKEIKFTNVLTPISFEKWTNATEGAIYDFAQSPDQMLLNRPKNITPIKNLYLLGAKTTPGAGIPGALFSAFSLSDILLKNKLTKGKFKLC